jgi:hypothetical protein
VGVDLRSRPATPLVYPKPSASYLRVALRSIVLERLPSVPARNEPQHRPVIPSHVHCPERVDQAHGSARRWGEPNAHLHLGGSCGGIELFDVHDLGPDGIVEHARNPAPRSITKLACCDEQNAARAESVSDSA